MEPTIGFDLRSIVPDLSWTADRRARHLLRRDVPSVRSVDPLVWERPPGLPPSPEPEGLWLNLPDLLAAARALDQAGAVVVRITALGEDEETPEGLDLVGSAFERYDLLGYDVGRLRPAGRPDQLGLYARGGGGAGAGLGASAQRMAPVRQARRRDGVRGGHGPASVRACAVFRLRDLSAGLISAATLASSAAHLTLTATSWLLLMWPVAVPPHALPGACARRVPSVRVANEYDARKIRLGTPLTMTVRLVAGIQNRLFWRVGSGRAR